MRVFSPMLQARPLHIISKQCSYLSLLRTFLVCADMQVSRPMPVAMQRRAVLLSHRVAAMTHGPQPLLLLLLGCRSTVDAELRSRDAEERGRDGRWAGRWEEFDGARSWKRRSSRTYYSQDLSVYQRKREREQTTQVLSWVGQPSSLIYSGWDSPTDLRYQSGR